MKTEKRTFRHKWVGGYILVTEYKQVFISKEIVWYKYVVKRRDGTVIEEHRRRGVTREYVDERIAYFQSITQEHFSAILAAEKSFNARKSYLPNTQVRAWSVS